MSRRLIAALLVFTGFVLLVSLVPLGITVSSRDRSDFAAGTRALAQSVASLAEDSFDDTRRPVDANRLRAAAGPDAAVVVVNAAGQAVVATQPNLSAPDPVLRSARAGRVVSTQVDDADVAAAPVVADGVIRGVVVVRRPDGPVDRRVTRLWVVLGGIAAVALLLSVAVAVATARWIARPLRRLGTTAHRWADGSLHERADPRNGPPEVREVATALNVMAGRLDTLVHGSRAVVADVSHQLRTPLAAMRLRLELLRDEVTRSSPGASVEEDIAVSLGEVDRLSRMVDGLLEVARAEGAASESVPIDAAAVVRERRQAWQPVAEERGVSVDVEANGAAMASVTEGNLEQILDNLLDNSLEAMPDGGRITMSVAGDASHVTMTVTDTGVGMTADQQESAFRRFVSGRADGGTGLGLAIVHRLVTADGGDVSLHSDPQGGTTVTVRLPAARGDDVTRAARRR